MSCLSPTMEARQARSSEFWVVPRSVIIWFLTCWAAAGCILLKDDRFGWVGDIRSRPVRLIPPAQAGTPLDALRTLLAYRLPAGAAARDEWRAIVEGRSPLWDGIPGDRKETIRGEFEEPCIQLCVLTSRTGFLVYFENEVLRRAHKGFSFANGR